MSRSFKKLCHNRYIKAISGKKDFTNRFRLKDLGENYPIKKINRIKSKKDKDLLASFCVDCCYNKGNISKILHKILSNKTDLNDSDYFKNRNQINLLMKQLKEQKEYDKWLLEQEEFEIQHNIYCKTKQQDNYYEYSIEKPKTKYELCKDLKNLTFMELKYLYSYGVENFGITQYGHYYEHHPIHDGDKFYFKNFIVLGNDHRGMRLFIDMKKYNTVKKVLDYLLTQGYGVLLPSLIPKGYSNYYYFNNEIKLIDYNSFDLDEYYYLIKKGDDDFIDRIRLIIETNSLMYSHNFEKKLLGGYMFSELEILADQVYWYYKLYR